MQYDVQVAVSDGGLSSVRTFLVNVIDCNEAPRFTNLTLTVSFVESSSVGYQFPSVRAVDPDAGGWGRDVAPDDGSE